MFVSKLSLTNFRNYRELDLALPEGVTILYGENAQGKTNLLEAVYLLATARSPRTTSEGELIWWGVPEGELPVARVAAEVHWARGDLSVEVVVVGARKGAFAAGSVIGAEGDDPKARILSAQKRVRINGLPHPSIDLLGQLNAVMFGPQDLDMVTGPPSLRRRYLDITLCQVDPHYSRVLQRYQRVLVQRNNLLRLLREGQAQGGELDYWDEALVESGSYIVLQRLSAVDSLKAQAKAVHSTLSGGQEELGISYEGTVRPGMERGSRDPEITSLRRAFQDALGKARPREVAMGQTTVGPHRDDVEFTIDGVKAGVHVSRGQQRTVAQALKLAEAHFVEARTGESPVLLLDDVLSELDGRRRRFLLDTMGSYHQVIITTTDLDRFEAKDLSSALLLRVNRGVLEPWARLLG